MPLCELIFRKYSSGGALSHLYFSDLSTNYFCLLLVELYGKKISSRVNP